MGGPEAELLFLVSPGVVFFTLFFKFLDQDSFVTWGFAVNHLCLGHGLRFPFLLALSSSVCRPG